MKASEVELFRAPGSGEPLTLAETVVHHGDIVEGSFRARDQSYAIREGIPRFVDDANYAQSFGYQWQTFATTQLDSAAPWGAQSETRLYAETRWRPAIRDLRGQRILEAGSGMGRFTEVLARTGAQICTFDFTQAIDANARNNRGCDNVSFAQANIYPSTDGIVGARS